MIGVQYAVSLNKNFRGNNRTKVTTVFCAQVPGDPFPHSSLTSLRTTTIDVCQNLEEWDWQITSPNIDQYLSSKKIGKAEIVKWAYEHKIPIEKTRSCYSSKKAQCGNCLSCQRRKEAFQKAGVIDKTKYSI